MFILPKVKYVTVANIMMMNTSRQSLFLFCFKFSHDISKFGNFFFQVVGFLLKLCVSASLTRILYLTYLTMTITMVIAPSRPDYGPLSHQYLLQILPCFINKYYSQITRFRSHFPQPTFLPRRRHHHPSLLTQASRPSPLYQSMKTNQCLLHS